MWQILVLFSVFAAIGGVLTLSEATMGVGFIGLACLLGILGRIAQSYAQVQVPMDDPAEVDLEDPVELVDGRIRLRAD